ncbi:MAG: hypothetical protein KF837_21750 [Labilithrix sp.]|nr:hypothetical protein [Labilithrix sp.]
MGEAANVDEDLTVRSLEEYAEAEAESRRHRAATELRLPEGDTTRAASTIPPGSKDATGALTDELREGLWAAIASHALVGDEEPGAWSAGVHGPVVHHVWSSPPIAGDPDNVPEDVVELIEEWFSIAKTGDVYALLETVLAGLPDASQARFASACNGMLEHGLSDHRFVGRRIMPIASKSDVATIERALVACRAKKLDEAELRLLGALEHLAKKPEPDPQEVVHEAIRAVQATAFALTKDRPLDLADALDTLEEHGHIDAALKARHGGLFAWVAQNGRRPRADDARLILVTCAGFVATLATRI